MRSGFMPMPKRPELKTVYSRTRYTDFSRIYDRPILTTNMADPGCTIAATGVPTAAKAVNHSDGIGLAHVPAKCARRGSRRPSRAPTGAIRTRPGERSPVRRSRSRQDRRRAEFSAGRCGLGPHPTGFRTRSGVALPGGQPRPPRCRRTTTICRWRIMEHEMLSITGRGGRATRHIALTAYVILGICALDARSGVRADEPWCASVQGPDGGYVSCSYSTWQKCMASLAGLGGICHPSPAASAAGEGDRPAARRRGRAGGRGG